MKKKNFVSVQYCTGFLQAQGVLLQQISAPSSVNLWYVLQKRLLLDLKGLIGAIQNKRLSFILICTTFIILTNVALKNLA